MTFNLSPVTWNPNAWDSFGRTISRGDGGTNAAKTILLLL